MLAIVLALASAIGYGGSDFAAGLASRSAGVIQVTLLASAVSAIVVTAALPFAASHPPSAAALAWGAVAGLGGTTGALALYLGFRHAAFSVAGPISAVGAAGFSVLAGLLLGERPTALALTGIVLALPAIVGTAASAARHRGRRGHRDGGTASAAAGTTAERPVTGGAGLVAGACFALLFIGLDRAGSGSGLWPVAATTVTELAAALAVAVATRNLRLPGARPRLLAVITGATGAAGTILFFFATHEGFLAVTAVLTSLYPAVTIVLARTLLGERLTALRLAGLALAAACVALIAVAEVNGGQVCTGSLESWLDIPQGQVCTGSLECMCSMYRWVIWRSASRRSRPLRAVSSATVAICQAAPVCPVRQRCSMMPSSRPATASSTPQRPSPSRASGSRRRRMSSDTGVSPTPGQYSCASRPCRAASCRFSAAVVKDIWVQIGRCASARDRTRP